MRITNWIGAIAGACLIHSAPVQACVVDVTGQCAPFPGTTLAEQPHLAGTTVANLVTPFSYLQEISTDGFPEFFPVVGSVLSSVVKSIDGSFDFYWQIALKPETTGTLSRMRLDDFVAASAIAGWRSDGVGDFAPTSGSVGGFNFFQAEGGFGEFGGFGNGTDHTLSTYSFFLDTDARAFDRSASFVLDSSLSHNFSQNVVIRGHSVAYATFAPAIPEPRAYTLMLAGLAALGWAATRQRGAARVSARG